MFLENFLLNCLICLSYGHYWSKCVFKNKLTFLISPSLEDNFLLPWNKGNSSVHEKNEFWHTRQSDRSLDYSLPCGCILKVPYVNKFIRQYIIFDRSLIIGKRTNSWNPERVSSVLTFVSVCVCVSEQPSPLFYLRT